MKKVFFIMALLITSGLYLTTMAQTDVKEIHIPKSQKGELKFIKHSNKALTVMGQEAQKLAIKGTAVVAFIPGEKTEAWISRMKVVGFFTNGDANTLGIAYTKAAEMADLLKDSGSGIRKPLTGEFGWQGGVIKKVKTGYILAVFSGGSGEQDVVVAKEGLNLLYKFYSKSK
ncbi:MAG TPA: hypothetical protein DCL77_00580 [Prolixibacteraceae bacterium]|jgi:hypothetical protein|nr:hypothetical protein [Prolixibacteraceae bacterium]